MPRILVVEDSPTQSEVLRLLLESEGFTIELAADARAALARLRAGRFDLVLSDVLMPEQSGYELCRQIKMDPATKDTPVVLLTQLTDPLDILHGLECGADNFLTKPIDAPYLVRRLRSVLANKAHPPDLGTPLAFRGKGITLTADKEQILELLLAAVEEVIRAQAREREASRAREKVEQEAADLAAAGRRKDEFLSLLAHELRNPLAPILTSLHLAAQPSTDAARRSQALETAQRQVRHLSHLLDDLLDASRLSWGKVQLRLQRLDLARLVRVAAEDRRTVLAQAGLTLDLHVPSTPVWTQGDATRLSQVIGNLLDNAAKFTDRRGQVTVELHSDASHITVAVRDTGIGIEPALLPRIFTALLQGDRSLDRPRGGLGLGLAVVKGLVELHGGTIEARSAGPGQGSEFVVRLPREPEPAALVTPAKAPTGAGQRRRVLVIEDNRDAADSLRLLLELLGHEVRLAATGPDGVQAATAWQPEVVISDIGLPGLDGYEVARRLRQLPGLQQGLLIALTGYGDAEDRRLARAAGFDHHLVKPADPAELERVLADRT